MNKCHFHFSQALNHTYEYDSRKQVRAKAWSHSSSGYLRRRRSPTASDSETHVQHETQNTWLSTILYTYILARIETP